MKYGKTDATFGGQAGRRASIVPINLQRDLSYVLKQQKWVTHTDAVLGKAPWHTDFFMRPVSGRAGNSPSFLDSVVYCSY